MIQSSLEIQEPWAICWRKFPLLNETIIVFFLKLLHKRPSILTIIFLTFLQADWVVDLRFRFIVFFRSLWIKWFCLFISFLLCHLLKFCKLLSAFLTNILKLHQFILNLSYFLHLLIEFDVIFSDYKFLSQPPLE